MKFTSRVLSIILVVCMLLPTIGLAATFTDVSSDHADYPAISLLTSLGIIKGYEDGTFGPDKNVTRAEFTVMLMRTLNMSGIGSSDPKALPFIDCDTVDWAVSDIRTAYELGIINGMSETIFAPQEQVTTEQALKMIVCAMGYEPMAIDVAGGKDKVWPHGYTNVATTLYINKGMSADYTAPAKRVEIAKYLYNALEVDLMFTTEYPNGAVRTEIRKDVNILNDKLKVENGYGELRADTKNSAQADGAIARDGEVIIYENETGRTEVFEINGIPTEGLVGRSIRYYYKENSRGDKVLLHIEDITKSSAVLSLDPEDIDDIKGSWKNGIDIFYWETDDARSTTEVNISADPVVSVNGRVTKTDSLKIKDLFDFDSGSIELISTGNTGVFDKINVVKYTTYVVGSVSTSSKMIIDLYKTATDGNTYILDEDSKSTVIDMRKTNGSTLSLASLKKYNVLSIKESTGSQGKSTIEVIVSTDKVSGTINAIDIINETITLNKTKYKLSKYVQTYATTQVDQLSVNDQVDFYLDKDGNIAAIDKSASTNSSYAYICKAATDDETETAMFRVYESSGSKIYTAASRIRLDGYAYSDHYTFVDDLEQTFKDEKSRLVKITKNSSGLISAIDSVAAANNEAETDLKLSIKKADYTYNSGSKAFKNSNTSFFVDSNTLFITIPDDVEDYSNYSKRNLSYFKGDNVYKGLEVYDLGTGSANKAKVVLIYGGGSAESLTASSQLFIISNADSIGQNDEGEQVRNVSGYLFGQGADKVTELKEILTDDINVLDDAVTGDVYRIAYTDGTYINDNSKKIVTTDGVMNDHTYEKLEGDSDYIIVHGLLVGTDEDSFVIADTDDIDDLIYEVASLKTYPYSVNENTVFVTYDASLSKKEQLLVGKDNILSTFPSFDDTKHFIQRDDNDDIISTDGVAATEIFAYILNNKVALVYMIKR